MNHKPCRYQGDIRFLSPNANNSLYEKKEVIDLEKEMKRIDDKYNKKLNLDEVLPFSKINEQKYLKYKEECDKRYEEQLKKKLIYSKTLNWRICALKKIKNI